MTLFNFKKSVYDLKNAFENAQNKGIDLVKSVTGNLLDFEQSKKIYFKKAYDAALQSVKKNSAELPNLVRSEPKNEAPILEVIELVKEITPANTSAKVTRILELCDNIIAPKDEKIVTIPNYIPQDVKPDVIADLEELEKCFSAECYRSAVIICGRLLEIALHRKYFETTGQDVLEKNPGIGLGKLIAKLAEKEVTFDPGLTQQIHLINQIRVFSVHKKQEAFYPSKAQAQAMILYTLDVLEKIFKR